MDRRAIRMSYVSLTPNRRTRFRRIADLSSGAAPPPPDPDPGPWYTIPDAMAALEPLIWFRFNDASGNAVDSGSRGVNATAVSITLYRNQAGPDGDSYVTLDGSADYFTLPDAADLGLNPVTGRTFAIAFRPTTTATGFLSLFSKMQAASPRDYALFAPTTGKIRAIAYQDSSSSTHSDIESDDTVSTNEWHYVVCRFDPGTSWTMFFDSPTENGTPFSAKTGTVEEDGTADLAIGALPAFAGYRFPGSIAHFSYWPTALSDAEVAALMEAATSEGWTP